MSLGYRNFTNTLHKRPLRLGPIPQHDSKDSSRHADLSFLILNAYRTALEQDDLILELSSSEQSRSGFRHASTVSNPGLGR
jgi:hypothetical protein